ncbi:GNAT family N-acetyltransferase [Sphingomonas psychrotolerans]|uniref:GNAT family N-acetyltransferase n=1 Tax=Sphingomonas psychrotolerans TaxID=1327635 RepID=A0ABU3N1D5_9SPHN|nr:GNAT family protein [Sphingomonas psychrotolerans]MDT8758368.1 GNAT family N-acetyltransferase [Sphingomonas psychrotolerans]
MSVWRDTPTLAGRHVRLRPMVADDRDALLDAFEGLHSLFHTTVPDADTFDAWYDRVMFDTAAGRNMPFTVLDAAGRVSGVTRFLRMSEPHRRVEIGGTLYAPRVQRTGLNTEAKYMLLGHAFEVLGVHCVQIRTDFLNHASRRAIERLGARLDGVLRGHLILKGHLRDSAVYSILAHEWPGVRRNLELLMARYDGGPT